MSGGEYNYAYGRLEIFAEDMKIGECLYRKRFKELVYLVSKAMHDIEWVDSGDYGEGDEIPAIKQCFAFGSQHSEE